MSHKNRNARSATADGRRLHAVADGPDQQNAPTSEGKVRAALTAHPGSTTADVAAAANVGRSTAAKILARWGHDGIAVRTAGTGPRNPDTWEISTPGPDVAAPDDAQPDATATPSADGPLPQASDTADATTDDTEAAETTVADVEGTVEEDTAAAQETANGPESDDATDTSGHQTAPPSDADSAAPAPETAPMNPVDNASETALSSADAPAVAADTTTGTARPGKDRLAKGQLRGLVEEYLTERTGESFGPAQIGKDLNRSGGAVNNACEKLVKDGYAIKTCEAPKRFAINPDKTDVPMTTENAHAPAQEA
ncbi:hypothetical protein [Amycolatopsis rubida]|uniref:Uncharacterized protein n=1 Tax=Amycolatopsis rubida TaxID=112413 RepID=A0A1I5E005_9PSEU|nr:hypothetical protein [Amycolatopsis rubida]SFO04660.1 hypothetical protein SAMN05421854_101424 [Amycolatopsis rubida]